VHTLCRHAHTCGLTYCTVGDSGGVKAPRQSQVGVRRIDSHEDIRPSTDERSPQPAEQSQQARQVPQNLEEAITASDSDGSQTSHPAARILGPATPKNSAFRREVPQCVDQARRERVARRFSRHQTHPQPASVIERCCAMSV